MSYEDDSLKRPADDETQSDDFDSRYEGQYTAPDDRKRHPDEAAQEPTGTRRRPPERRSAPAPRRGYGCADVITALFLLLTVMVISVTILLIANPQSVLNPLPPPTLPPVRVLATPLPTSTTTPTLTPEPPTPTIPTATPTHSATPTDTATPTLTFTPVVGGIVTIPAQSTPIQPAQGTRSPFPFSVKSIRYQANETQQGCEWQSIAGIVLNMQGAPRSRAEGALTVKVKSADGNIDEFHYTGEQPRFGESGFEIFLGERPRVADYTLQLLSVTGTPISDLVAIQTRTTCEENVVVVEFIQNYPY